MPRKFQNGEFTDRKSLSALLVRPRNVTPRSSSWRSDQGKFDHEFAVDSAFRLSGHEDAAQGLAHVQFFIAVLQ
jgi:hypothetical protein